MTSNALRVGVDAPFPWPGSKRRVADVIWQALGDVHNYVEPFAGSLAVLLRRPADHTLRAETVSDLNGHIANFWRAVKLRPDEVAAHADYPVSHVDVTARHRWLIDERPTLIAGLDSDPEWCDPKAAGWWVWGLSQWIGSGWCAENSRPRPCSEQVSAKRPHLADAGKGIHAQRPHLADARKGIHAHTSGCHASAWMSGIATRLRHVRILHCDWSRATSSGCLNYGASVGVMLDPPYDPATLASKGVLYDEHSTTVAAECREWAIRTCADDPRVRVVLCGYEEEHAPFLPNDWRMLSWSSTGMQSTVESQSNETRHKERLWLSPSCLPVDTTDTICSGADAATQLTLVGVL